MPIYEYHCRRCDEIEERLRSIPERDEQAECGRCGDDMVRIVSAPSLGIWNGERKFPNLSPTGDGSMTFPSRSAYEAHLKEQHIAEVGIKAPVKRPHGNRVIGTWQ